MQHIMKDQKWNLGLLLLRTGETWLKILSVILTDCVRSVKKALIQESNLPVIPKELVSLQSKHI